MCNRKAQTIRVNTNTFRLCQQLLLSTSKELPQISLTMSSIINALSDLVSSLVELVWSFFTTSVHLVENTGKFAAKFATEIIDLIINFFKGLVDLAGGIVSFLVGKRQSLSPCIPCSNMSQVTLSCSPSWPLPSSASSSTSAARDVLFRSVTRSSTRRFHEIRRTKYPGLRCGSRLYFRPLQIE
jgi:hypothetical protein